MSGYSLHDCLSRLEAAVEDPEGLSRALCCLRSRHVSRAGGAEQFRESGGLKLLMLLFTEPPRAAVLGASRRNLDLALSLLANCCLEPACRLQVQELGGIPVLVSILKSVCVDSIWNRVARALGNLALDAENSSIIHKSGAISPLINILENSKDPFCLQSCLRALRILGGSPVQHVSICEQGGLSPCVSLLSSPSPGLVEAAVRSVCELSRGSSLDCAEKLSSAVPVLVALAGKEDAKPKTRQAAISTLCNLCGQGAMRPILGNAGAIQLLITEARNHCAAPSRCIHLVRALCLCCREAVNRCRVKEQGGLELLMDFLRDSQYRSTHYGITAAFLHFCHDTSSLALLSAKGLASLLAEKLDDLALAADDRGELQELLNAVVEEEDAAAASFDFPPEPKRKRQGSEITSEESLRSWLLSEGYICSLEDLAPDWCLDSENKSDDSAAPRSTDLSSLPTAASSCSDGDQFLSPRVKRMRLNGISRRDQRPPPSPNTPKLLSSPTSFKPCFSPVQEILGSPWPLEPRTPPPSEFWGPEFPGLLLLSCFSQLPESSPCLVSPTVLGALLTYVTCHPRPSPRAARLLQRLTCDPACFEAFIRTGGICTLRARLLLSETPGNKSESNNRHPELAKELGHVLLRNLGIQAESPFGVGAVTHMLRSGPQSDRLQCALTLPYIYKKDSPQREQLLDAALHLVLTALLQCTDSVFPVFFFHASECLSTLLTPQALAAQSPASLGPSQRCHYTELVARGEGDVVFVLDGGEKIVGSRKEVTGGCEVFRAMLEGGYAESRQREVCVRQIPSFAFIPLLHYLHGCTKETLCPTFQGLQQPYSGGDLTQSPLGSTLAAAGRFLLPGLADVLEDIARNYLLSLDSLPSLYCFVEMHESANLRRDCCLYLLKRPHPPRQRALCLFQLCQRAQDKKRLFELIEDIVQEESHTK
ncbi:armadillo repeat-containing protein 5 [Xenopus laevis]|uniref:BTB domain-containing protein n=2 Tax=Xenopus laevis TaxID=8355 RepID=A0A974C0V1_XENLA|nr:armadillo repeat-containing protein 5 [Xenopus laevis]OCT64522.1 hypothetical protein XELAEV_18045621mg [Xenopus laevis]